MITLITGAPGAGKTAALVSMLEDFLKAGRPLYVDGIPELVYDHVDFNVDNWMDEVPDGSIVVVDEVQRRWRPAGSGQKIPPAIAGLETHRHRGLDFYIITQEPRLVHSNVRALVGRHVHLRDVGVLGRYWYEWPECCAQPGEKFKAAPIRMRYKLPKRIFGKYKSASEHIKPVRSFPRRLIVLGVALLLLPPLGWNVYKIIAPKLPGAEKPAAKPSPGAQPAGMLVAAPAAPVSSYNPGAFMPRNQADPATAPAYDHLRKVVDYPRIVGGYCMDGKCVCYTQQSTILEIDERYCSQWIKNPPFDPYRAPRVEVAARPAAAASGAL